MKVDISVKINVREGCDHKNSNFIECTTTTKMKFIHCTTHIHEWMEMPWSLYLNLFAFTLSLTRMIANFEYFPASSAYFLLSTVHKFYKILRRKWSRSWFEDKSFYEKGTSVSENSRNQSYLLQRKWEIWCLRLLIKNVKPQESPEAVSSWVFRLTDALVSFTLSVCGSFILYPCGSLLRFCLKFLSAFQEH